MSKPFILFISLFSLIFYIKADNPIETIDYEDGLAKSYQLTDSKSFEVLLEKVPPELIKVSVKSKNNIRQKVSFSKQSPTCQNPKGWFAAKNPRENALEFSLNLSQLSENKLYICIECNGFCEFDILFSSISPLKSRILNNNLKGEKQFEGVETSSNSLIEIDLDSLYSPPKFKEEKISTSITGALSKNYNISIYGLKIDCITIPSNYNQTYQIPHTAGTKYKFKGGRANCSETGLIAPIITTWYWYGNSGTTRPPKEGETPDKITYEPSFGESTITATHSDNTSDIYTVYVTDYSIIYADEKIAEYMKLNVTDAPTLLDKLDRITFYPATFEYGKYSKYNLMIACKEGGCEASAEIIHKMCGIVGIPSHIRYGANEDYAMGQHMNAAALINGEVYICEAGFSGHYTPRFYDVRKENVGWYYKKNSRYGDDVTIIQYDGFENDLVVPEKIDGYNVMTLGPSAFTFGEKYSGVVVKSVTLNNGLLTIEDSCFNSLHLIKKIRIPASVTKIGNLVFTNMKNLTEIEVDKENKNFTSVDGILYDKNKSTILYYPTNKEGDLPKTINANDSQDLYSYTAPESLTKVGNHSFYNTLKINKVVLPKNLKIIDEAAFGDSQISQIYFSGNPPSFGENCFQGLNLEVYYPKDNPNWDPAKIGEFNSTSIKFNEWVPPNDNPSNPKSGRTSAGIVVLIIVIIVLVLGAGAFYYFKIRKDRLLAESEKMIKN